MSDYPMLISNKLHSFRNFPITKIKSFLYQMDFIKKIIGMKELPVHQFKPILT